MTLNGWRIMWVLAAFDLPTKTKGERKAYTQFRKRLLREGFVQVQYSVYARHCETFAAAEALVNRLGTSTPKKGSTAFFYLTDKQYGLTRTFLGKTETDHAPKAPDQLLLFS